MYIDLTEKQLLEKFYGMSTKEIIGYLMDEGLTLKYNELDFSDVPGGIYRRVEGTDLVYYNRFGSFKFVDFYGRYPEEKVAWSLPLGGGDWWVLVLNDQNEPVINGLRFKVDKDGNRLA